MHFMDDMHKEMLARNGLYKFWHSIPFISFFHFVILIGVGSYIALSLQMTLLDQAAQQAAVSSSASFGQGRSSLAQLNAQLFAASKRYNNARTDAERTNHGAALSDIAVERKTAFLDAAQNSPHDFLLNVLPEDVQEKLPDVVQSLLEEEVNVEGELTVIHVDPPAEGGYAERTLYELDADSATAAGHTRLHLHFDGDAPEGLVTGTKVKVHGIALDQELVPMAAAGGGGGTTVTTQAAATATGPQKTLVILLNFTNNTSQPFTVAQTADVVFNGIRSTDAFYEESSFGSLSLYGDVVGWYTIPYDTTYACNVDVMAAAADQAATAAGVAVSTYPHKIYMWNQAGCGWGGMGTIGGNPSQAWIPSHSNNADSSVVSHEFGHNILAHHAQWLKCGAKAIDSYANCTIDEYGDRSDVMGYMWGYYFQFVGARKLGESWLSNVSHMQTVTANGTYTISPSETNDANVKLLKIAKPDTNESYYLSFRQAVGAFDITLPPAFVNGVGIHLWNGSVTSQTKLIDTTPGDNNPLNAPLADGTSFADPANGITITQLSHTPTTVTVSAQFTGAQCVPGAPNLNLSPLTQSGSSGAPKIYTLTLKNTDSATCPSAAYALSNTVPSGWTGTLSTPSLTLAPGVQSSATITVTPPAIVTDGTYTVTGRAVDASVGIHQANTAATYVSFTDVTPPTVTITSPADGAVIKGKGNVNVSAYASDSSGIASIVLKIDGTTVKTCTAVTSCSYKWTINKISVGSHTVVATATDKAGFTSSASVTVTK